MIARTFGLVDSYDQHAHVQRRVAGNLAERITTLPLPANPRVLEIGCGTGFLSAALMPQLPGASWTITDIAPEMVERARAVLPEGTATFLAMDGEQPTLPPQSFDLVCSSLAAQWFTNLGQGISNLAAMVAPGGTLALATMARGSFANWRAAHEAAGVSAATPSYPDKIALWAMAPANSKAVVEIEDEIEPYADARAFLKAFKNIGAGVPRAGHQPLSPKDLHRVMQAFERSDPIGPSAHYRIAYAMYRIA